MLVERVYLMPLSPDGPPITRNLYEFRWQTNAFLVRELSDIRDLTVPSPTDGALFGGHYGDDYWSIQAKTLNLSYGSSPATPTAGKSDDVRRLVEYGKTIFMEVMSFGTFFAKSGSLEWSNNFFRAKYNDGRAIAGNVTFNADGQPDKLTYQIKGDDMLKFLVKYHFSTNPATSSMFPNKVELAVSTGEKDIQNKTYQVYDILVLKTNPNPMPARHFMHSAFSQFATDVWHHTNGGIYRFDMGVIRSATDRGTDPLRPKQRIYYVFAFLIMGAAFLIFMLRIGIRNKQQPT